MNTKLLKRVAQRIRLQPERYAQGLYGSEPGNGFASGCGGAACVAGWAVALSGEPLSRHGVWDQAKELLDLTGDEAFRLFCESWPVEWVREVDPTARPYPAMERTWLSGGVIPAADVAAAVLELMAADGRVWPMAGRVEPAAMQEVSDAAR